MIIYFYINNKLLHKILRLNTKTANLQSSQKTSFIEKRNKNNNDLQNTFFEILPFLLPKDILE